MNRQQHLQWCKDRAMEYVKAGDLTNAVASMMFDLNKHPETAVTSSVLALLGLLAAQQAQRGDRDGVVLYIKSFN